MLLPAKYAAPVARLAFLTIAGLSAFLLTARYKLSLPDDYPYGTPTRIGKQAWELSFRAGRQTTLSSASSNATSPFGDDEVTDWEDDDEDGWNLPVTSKKWDPLVSQATPITEIQVKSCVLPPGLYDLCSPTSTKKEDATRGVWQRVDRDLNKRIGVYYEYIFYRRLLPGSTASVVTNITLLDHSPTSDDLAPGGVWVEVSESLRTGLWPRMSAPMFLHYKLTAQADVSAARKMSSNANAGPDLEPITELDVIYGGKDVKPLFSFTKVSTMITGGHDDDQAVGVGLGKGKRVGTSLAYRRDSKKLPSPPTLRFSATGNFTILQVADLHFSVGPGACRDMDAMQKAECESLGADVYSLQWLAAALEWTKPDLVVLSGDQLNGQDTSWSSQSAILKWAPIIYEKAIPWTVVFGNHDEEQTDLTHDAQMALMRSLPYFVGEAGPTTVDGTGNYVRSIRANDTDTVLSTLYFLDSHAYAKSLTPWGNKGYDSLKANQINWFRGRSSQVKAFRRPYSPFTHKTRSTSSRRTRKRQAGIAEDDEINPDDDTLGGDVELNPGELEVLEALAEEEELEREEIAEEEEAMGVDVMPSDGSQIHDSDQEMDDIEDDDTNPLLELEEESNLTPTKIVAGPTKASPLVAKPNALVFFHIPLLESYDSPIDVGADGKRLLVGDRFEGNGASKSNSGFFNEALLAQGELVSSGGSGGSEPVDEFWDDEFSLPTTGRPEVKVVANGHCHITEDCRRVQGIWLCFGGGGSYSGYGKAGIARRMRVYSLSQYGERIETYKLLDTKERIDQVVLVGEDALGQ